MGSVTQLRPRARRRRRRWPVVLLAVVALGAGLYVWKPVPLPSAAPAEPEPLAGVRRGILKVTLDADAVLVRRETVYRAPQAGTVRRLAEEGARVRVGGQVVAFTPGAAAPRGRGGELSSGQTASATDQGAPAAGRGAAAIDRGAPTADRGTLASDRSGAPAADRPTTPPDRSSARQSAVLPLTASPVRQEYDRLAAELYATAVALQQAQLRGEETASYQQRLDELAHEQLALLPALQRDMAKAGTEAAPLPDGAGQASDPQPASGGAEAALPDLPEDLPAGVEQVITTRVSGVVLYQTDGLESILTPEAVAAWGPSALYRLPYPTVDEISDGPVASGEPLFKLVDDLTVEMLLLVPGDSLSESQRAALPGREVQLQVSGRDLPLTAQVLRVAAEGSDLLIHLEAPVPSAEALRLRRMRVSLLIAEFEGTIVPRSAIDVEGGRTGVWVAERNGYRFEPVRVLGGTAGEVAVEEELPPDTQVLTAPPPPAK